MKHTVINACLARAKANVDKYDMLLKGHDWDDFYSETNGTIKDGFALMDKIADRWAAKRANPVAMADPNFNWQ